MVDNPNPKVKVRCRCLFCGKLFWSERSTAEYDTASCKQKMYRWRKKLDTQTKKVLQGVRELASYLTYDKSTPAAVNALNQIRHEISDLLLKHQVVVVK
jgi:hypothetical protein